MQRINVIGTSGCGKSTFSKRLSAALGASYIEIDKLYWGPGWTYCTDEQLCENLEAQLSRENWVLDGNYAKTVPVKWKNVQAVIWLDYSWWRVVGRAVKRAVWRAATRAELWEGTGNRESFKKLFGSDSIVLWTLKTFSSNRIKYTEAMTDKNYAHIRFIRLSNPREAEEFLKGLR